MLSNFWSTPLPGALANTLVSALESCNPRTLLVASSCYTALNAALYAVPHDHMQFFLSKTCRGWRRSDKLQENLPRWLAMPIKWRSSVTVDGTFICVIAVTFSGSADTPFFSTIWPWNFSLVWPKEQFSLLSVAPTAWIWINTAVSWSSCSLCALPNNTMLSIWHTTPSNPCKILAMHHWKCSKALYSSKNNQIVW